MRKLTRVTILTQDLKLKTEFQSQQWWKGLVLNDCPADNTYKRWTIAVLKVPEETKKQADTEREMVKTNNLSFHLKELENKKTHKMQKRGDQNKNRNHWNRKQAVEKQQNPKFVLLKKWLSPQLD